MFFKLEKFPLENLIVKCENLKKTPTPAERKILSCLFKLAVEQIRTVLKLGPDFLNFVFTENTLNFQSTESVAFELSSGNVLVSIQSGLARELASKVLRRPESVTTLPAGKDEQLALLLLAALSIAELRPRFPRLFLAKVEDLRRVFQESMTISLKETTTGQQIQIKMDQLAATDLFQRARYARPEKIVRERLGKIQFSRPLIISGKIQSLAALLQLSTGERWKMHGLAVIPALINLTTNIEKEVTIRRKDV